MSIRLSFERRTVAFHTDAITIGRDSTNQVAFPNDFSVAPHHAVLKHVGGRWIVEARNGGSLRIGNGRPCQFAWLNPGDVIYLTESGPEIVFNPMTDAEAPVTRQSNPARPSSPAAIRPYSPLTRASSPRFSVSAKDSSNRMVLAALGLVSLFAIAIMSLTLASRNPRRPDMVANVEAKPSDPKKITKTPEPDPPQSDPVRSISVDPREFLVLIGIGDLTTDNRPNVLGVGWLCDAQTAICSHRIGETIELAEKETLKLGRPRQGCVIQGIPVEIDQVDHPAACTEIAILRLKRPVELPQPASAQWKKMNCETIERLRGKGKSLTYYSYHPLPRPESVRGSHGFPLCEYDPDKCRINKDDARVLYEQSQHYLTSPNYERGGLLVDEDQRIVGMVLSSSQIIWTEGLEPALQMH